MGLVKGLHHLDAKAVVSAEEHCVVDGASGSAPPFGSHQGPRMPATGSAIGSGATALGVGDSGEARQEEHAQIWPRATPPAVMGVEPVDGWKQWR